MMSLFDFHEVIFLLSIEDRDNKFVAKMHKTARDFCQDYLRHMCYKYYYWKTFLELFVEILVCVWRSHSCHFI